MWFCFQNGGKMKNKDIYLTNVKILILFLCSPYRQLVDEVNMISGSEVLFCMPKEVFIQSLNTSMYAVVLGLSDWSHLSLQQPTQCCALHY